MLHVDVIEALVPGLQAPLRQWEDLPAEPAPELALAVAADAVLCQKVPNSRIGFFQSVIVSEMSDEQLLAVVQARAFSACILLAGQRTAPALQEEMLPVLVALPVGFAAEGFVAFVKGAAEGFLVPRFVFSVIIHIRNDHPKKGNLDDSSSL